MVEEQCQHLRLNLRCKHTSRLAVYQTLELLATFPQIISRHRRVSYLHRVIPPLHGHSSQSYRHVLEEQGDRSQHARGILGPQNLDDDIATSISELVCRET